MLDAAHRRWKSSISHKWPRSSKGQPCRKSSTTLATQISVQSTHCEMSVVHWSYCADYVPIAMIKLSKCFNLLDMHSTVCACAVAICLGFWEPRKLTGLPGIQNPRLRVTFWFFHPDRIFAWKKEMHLWSSRNKRACPTEKEEAFARGKTKVCRERQNHPQTGDWQFPYGCSSFAGICLLYKPKMRTRGIGEDQIFQSVWEHRHYI